MSKTDQKNHILKGPLFSVMTQMKRSFFNWFICSDLYFKCLHWARWSSCKTEHEEAAVFGKHAIRFDMMNSMRVLNLHQPFYI